MTSKSPLLLVALLCGCGSSIAALREPDEYLGCATDENWRLLDDHELTGQVTIDDKLAPMVTAPSSGATLPATTKPTFSWQISPTLPGKPNGDAACMDRCALCGQHLPPVSGDIYDLQFSTGGVLRWRTLTSLQSYTPSDQAWTVLKAQTESISLRIESVNLKENGVQGGPYQPGTSFSFTVSK